MNDISLSSLNLEQRRLMSGQYWDELQVFAAVAQGRSFNRAAQQLGLSQPTIARKVRRLQDVLGAKLFLSTRQGVQLTDRGEELAEAVFKLDRSLFNLTRDLRLRAADIDGSVGLAAPDDLFPVLAKADLAAFAGANPRVQLKFKRASAPDDWRGNGTDIALTTESVVHPECTSRLVGAMTFVSAASPDYIERWGQPTRETLASHSLVRGEFVSTTIAGWADWQALFDDCGSVHDCSSSCAHTTLVASGLGIGLVARHRLPGLDLVAVDLGVTVTADVHLATLRDRTDVLPGKAALDWLNDRFGSLLDKVD